MSPFRPESTPEICPDCSTVTVVEECPCARKACGKEEEPRTRKPFVGALRVPIPPGRAGPAARSESCVVVGRPTLRSVDSEVKGRVIEPRKLKMRGAFVVDIGGGRVRRCCTWSHRTRLVLPGSESTDDDHQGSPGTWEAPTSPSKYPDRETGHQTPRPPVGRPRPRGANHGRNDGIGPRRHRSGPRRTAGSRSAS